MQKLTLRSKALLQRQTVAVNAGMRTRFPGPLGQALLPQVGLPIHPELPESHREMLGSEGQCGVKLKADLSWPFLLTGPHAASPCTAQAALSPGAVPQLKVN